MEMRCPRCIAALFDTGLCSSCRGAWVDARWVKEHVWPKMAERDGETLRCPVCRQDTRPVALEGVAVDCCGAGDGVWFDGGELAIAQERGRAHVAADAAGPVPNVMTSRSPVASFFISLLEIFARS